MSPANEAVTAIIPAHSQRKFPSAASEPASTAATPIGSGRPIAPSSSVNASAG